MATLDPRADKIVREAIDAFMDGRLVPDFAGETVFETKNSRYRLVDGVVYAAPDPSLVGAELVGWLCESQRRCLVESAWQPGSRAVLVDRKNARNIIVTSTTRLLHQEAGGSGSYQAGSLKPQADFRSWHPPADPSHVTPLPSFSSQSAPIDGARSPLRGHPAIVAATPLPSDASLSPLPPPDAPRRAAVHPPPRPIGPRVAPAAARLLPPPAPPPRRDSPPPPAPTSPTAPTAVPALRVPALPPVPPPLEPTAARQVPVPESTEWALTSAELEMVVEDDAPFDDAPHSDREAPFELRAPRRAEPVNAEPFPLVRSADTAPPSSAPRR